MPNVVSDYTQLKNLKESPKHADKMRNNYIGYIDRVFYTFESEVNKPVNTLPDKNAWKFHIGVDDADIEKAWRLIGDILIKHDIAMFKVVTPEANFSTNQEVETQGGKQVTVYAYQDKRAEDFQFWAQITEEIEQSLRENNIKPCPNRDKNEDTKVPGSYYIGYHSDTVNNPDYTSPFPDDFNMNHLYVIKNNKHIDDFLENAQFVNIDDLAAKKAQFKDDLKNYLKSNNLSSEDLKHFYEFIKSSIQQGHPLRFICENQGTISSFFNQYGETTTFDDALKMIKDKIDSQVQSFDVPNVFYGASDINIRLECEYI
ncbi:hypothetical protein L3V83_01270 [Thiotrichales bacterium 19X7-9]|nr:hypothetical protein [Thiotrichales bacterium 19X7-9]